MQIETSQKKKPHVLLKHVKLMLKKVVSTCHSCASRSPEKAYKMLDSRVRGNDIVTLYLLCFIIIYAGINKQLVNPA